MLAEIPYAKKELAKTGGTRVSPDRIQWIKKESAMVLTKNSMVRDKTKEDMFLARKEKDLLAEAVREERSRVWQKRTKNSPFAVNLVAETERIYEENQIRMKEEQERRDRIDSRREKAKNDLILKVIKSPHISILHQ